MVTAEIAFIEIASKRKSRYFHTPYIIWPGEALSARGSAIGILSGPDALWVLGTFSGHRSVREWKNAKRSQFGVNGLISIR
jgi:hypothetical protein